MIPKFDFQTQRRAEAFRPLKIHKDEIVVFEGIHALNPSVVGKISQCSTGIYISLRTRIRKNDGQMVDPEYMRIIRRIIRDYTHRARKASETLSVLESVRRGEQSYIMPFKINADIALDTFIPYEDCVMAPIAQKLLHDEKCNLYAPEVMKLMTLIDGISPLAYEDVPKDSLLHEFIS